MKILSCKETFIASTKSVTSVTQFSFTREVKTNSHSKVNATRHLSWHGWYVIVCDTDIFIPGLRWTCMWHGWQAAFVFTKALCVAAANWPPTRLLVPTPALPGSGWIQGYSAFRRLLLTTVPSEIKALLHPSLSPHPPNRIKIQNQRTAFVVLLPSLWARPLPNPRRSGGSSGWQTSTAAHLVHLRLGVMTCHTSLSLKSSSYFHSNGYFCLGTPWDDW